MTASRTTNVVWGAVVIFVATLGSIVALSFSVSDGEQLLRLIGLILPAAGTLLLGMLALDRIGKVDEKVDRVEKHTTDLTNGLMDSKMRAAIADAVKDAYLDPGAAQLIEADRRRRDANAAAAPDNPA